MALLSDADRMKLTEMLSEMTSDVRLVFFTQTLGCETCADAKRILDEVVPLNAHLSLEEHNLVLEGEEAAKYGIDRVPAIAVVGEQGDAGIRFYGAPAGYEFMSLIEAILVVSSGDSGLSPGSRALLAAVDQPTRIQVFVTPT
jgi:alkyl hydroperoxide reductase subunit AhpF